MRAAANGTSRMAGTDKKKQQPKLLQSDQVWNYRPALSGRALLLAAYQEKPAPTPQAVSPSSLPATLAFRMPSSMKR